MSYPFITMPTFSKFLESQRGGKLLVDTEGYLYSRKRANKDCVIYLCRRNTRSKKVVEQILQLPCPAKLHFYEDERLFLEVPHNHEPQVPEAECMEVKCGMKRKAEEQTLTPTQNIISESLSGFNGADHLLPRIQSLARLVQRSREIPEETPGTKKSHRADYILSDDCKQATDGFNSVLSTVA